MALTNPRNTVAYDEIGADAVTFLIDNSTITYDGTLANGAATTMIGKAVTLSAANTVALAADGDPILGKLLSVESDNKCAVQIEGYMTLPGGASAALTRGKKIVGALGAASAKGYIREATASGATYLQAEAVEALKARGFIQDAGTTTAVLVWLG
jgi:hypothetical protein